MGLLDDAIREHLELKRRRGANPDEVARQEEAALGPPRRGDFAQPGAEPAAAPAEDFERPPAEAVRIRPVEDDREPFADEVPEFDPLGADEPGPAADEVAAYEPGPAADEVAPYEPEPAEDEVAPYAPEPAAEDVAAYAPRTEAGEVADREPAPSDRPEADLGDLPGPDPAEPSPALAPEPAPRRRAPAADWLDDEPDEVPPEDALERPRPAAEPGDEDEPPAGDEDVLEETPEFLQETPEHDRLWFEQRPPRDFDFDK
jgi:hypothetical protein